MLAGDLVIPFRGVRIETSVPLTFLRRCEAHGGLYRRDIERHDDLLADRWTHIRLGKGSPPHSAVARTRAALRAAGLWV